MTTRTVSRAIFWRRIARTRTCPTLLRCLVRLLFHRRTSDWWSTLRPEWQAGIDSEPSCFQLRSRSMTHRSNWPLEFLLQSTARTRPPRTLPRRAWQSRWFRSLRWDYRWVWCLWRTQNQPCSLLVSLCSGMAKWWVTCCRRFLCLCIDQWRCGLYAGRWRILKRSTFSWPHRTFLYSRPVWARQSVWSLESDAPRTCCPRSRPRCRSWLPDSWRSMRNKSYPMSRGCTCRTHKPGCTFPPRNRCPRSLACRIDTNTDRSGWDDTLRFDTASSSMFEIWAVRIADRCSLGCSCIQRPMCASSSNCRRSDS